MTPFVNSYNAINKILEVVTKIKQVKHEYVFLFLFFSLRSITYTVNPTLIFLVIFLNVLEKRREQVVIFRHINYASKIFNYV